MPAEQRQVAQAHAGDEEHAEQRGEVDERRAEVGLDEDEAGGQRRVGDAQRGRSAACRCGPALRAISAASASSSVSLPSSDGWNWKNGNWIQRRDPRVEKPSSEDDRDEADRADVERPLEAPEALDVEERRARTSASAAERQVDLLLDDERVRRRRPCR